MANNHAKDRRTNERRNSLYQASDKALHCPWKDFAAYSGLMEGKEIGCRLRTEQRGVQLNVIASPCDENENITMPTILEDAAAPRAPPSVCPGRTSRQYIKLKVE